MFGQNWYTKLHFGNLSKIFFSLGGGGEMDHDDCQPLGCPRKLVNGL